jgi:NIPSNAP
MNRRDFLASSMAAGVGGGLQAGGSMAQAQQSSQAYFELRRYDLRVGPMADRMHEYLKDVSLPAHNRAGVRTVGAFTPVYGGMSPAIYLLLAYPSVQELATLASRLDADAAFRKAADAHAGLPATDPAYLRIHSQLMAAATFMPTVEVPPSAAGNKPRIFELRTYESHSKRASRKKLQMFGEMGELSIFRRTGLRPVFFGDNVIGERLPSFTYMLTFDDMAAREKNWATFIADPEWVKLRATEGYTDPEIVSNIASIILRPTPYSQL